MTNGTLVLVKDFPDNSSFENSESINVYESILKLVNIDYTFVGYYYCIYSLAESMNKYFNVTEYDSNAPKIYIFVDGKY